jgi:hypothetical protein
VKVHLDQQISSSVLAGLIIRAFIIMLDIKPFFGTQCQHAPGAADHGAGGIDPEKPHTAILAITAALTGK